MRSQNLLVPNPVVPSRAAVGAPRPMHWVRAASAVLVALCALGCEDDLGKCDPADLARSRTVVVNGEGQAIYAGQAILNDSCAAGRCHASAAKDAQRVGAPAGLDFDLEPATEVPAGPNAVTSGGLTLDAAALARLRSHQRIVFDERQEIWEQVKDGLMPPDGVGEEYRTAVPGRELLVSGATCKRGEAEVRPIAAGSTKEILRNWLACGAPVVEASSAAVPVASFMRQPAGVAGTVGQQMPFCQSCDDPTTFEDIYKNVIEPSCLTGCHSTQAALGELALEGIDVAYEALTMSSGKVMGCQVPFVVPGKPADSYIIAKMGGSEISKLPLCGLKMPYGQAVLACGVQQLARWIRDGAKGPGQGTGEVPDAGM